MPTPITIHEGKAIKLYLFINDIDSTEFAKILKVSRVWLYKLFEEPKQTEKTWNNLKKFTNVNKQTILSHYFKAYNDTSTLQMISIEGLTIDNLKEKISKFGAVILY